LQDVVVITVSASSFGLNQEQSLLAGSQAFLSKPISLEELFALLEIHLHLEWKYNTTIEQADDQTTAVTDLVPPPLEELEMLYELARRGNMRRISRWALALDQPYKLFADQIQSLAEAFEGEQILALTQQLLENK